MELEQLRKSIKEVLSESRYNHSLGVEEVCYDLALIHGTDTQKASITGILHDCAKYMSGIELIKICEDNQLKISETERELPVHLLHAKVGALYAKEKYGVVDEDILNAITYHTTGRPAMSELEKIVYVADYIEPNRKPFPWLNKIRKIAYEDIDKAVIIILSRTLKYLNENVSIIDPLTKETYKYYVNLK